MDVSGGWGGQWGRDKEDQSCKQTCTDQLHAGALVILDSL